MPVAALIALEFEGGLGLLRGIQGRQEFGCRRSHVLRRGIGLRPHPGEATKKKKQKSSTEGVRVHEQENGNNRSRKAIEKSPALVDLHDPIKPLGVSGGVVIGRGRGTTG